MPQRNTDVVDVGTREGTKTFSSRAFHFTRASRRGFHVDTCGRFARHDVPVWISERHVRPSRRWIDEIGRALDRCDWFAVVLTPAAVRSLWVQREVYFVLQRKRFGGRIVPLLVKKCNVTRLAWPLTAIQMINFTPYERGIRDLLAIWGVAQRSA